MYMASLLGRRSSELINGRGRGERVAARNNKGLDVSDDAKATRGKLSEDPRIQWIHLAPWSASSYNTSAANNLGIGTSPDCLCSYRLCTAHDISCTFIITSNTL